MYFLALSVVLGLCLIVLILSAYGTRVRNKWGVNKQPVFCPRCNTQLPAVRQPQSLQQALWGGWTCMVCGIEVDKWGRELASVGSRRRRFIASGQYRKVLMKRVMIVFISTLFCGVVIFHTLMLRESRVTFTWFVAFTVTSLAIVETTVGTLIFYFVMRYSFKRFSPDVKERNSAQANESDRNPKG